VSTLAEVTDSPNDDASQQGNAERNLRAR